MPAVTKSNIVLTIFCLFLRRTIAFGTSTSSSTGLDGVYNDDFHVNEGSLGYVNQPYYGTKFVSAADSDENDIATVDSLDIARALCSSLSLTAKQASAFLTATGGTTVEKGKEVLDKVTYFRNEVGMSKERLRKLIAQHPKLVATVFLEDVKTTMEFLQEELELSQRQIRTLTAASPSVIRYYRTDLRRNIAFLRGPALKLSSDGLKKLVLKRPQLLGYSIEKLQLTTHYFKTYLGIYGEDLGFLVTRFPFLLAYSVENNLAPSVAFIREELFGYLSDRIERNIATSSLVTRFPQILGYSIEHNLNKKASLF